MMDNTVLSARQISKTYQEGRLATSVLYDVDFDVKTGEMVSIVGKSGSGKSTLLHILGSLDQPTAGTVSIMGQAVTGLGDDACSALRNQYLGFVYQFHHLLPEFTVLENVMMPLLVRGGKRAAIVQQATALLTQVGLAERLQHKPAEISGGERQRTAVARALVTRPACVLADEPTGNLDSQNAALIFDLMLQMNKTQGTSFVIVTHDMALAEKMDRVVHIEDGRL